nr:PREDICTED: peptide transporter family 1-like [Bemisia tabaci]
MVADNWNAENADQPLKYPRSVFFILASELCERYSFFGARVILALYLRNFLHYSKEDAISIFHIFTFLCYFLPIFGGVLADSYIGKYRTILYSSVIHVVGNILMAVAATQWSNYFREFSLLGLFLTAFGTGLMKPCMCVFGGDQFVLPQQAKQLATYFSIFYLCVTIGSLLAAIAGPILRQDVTCLGESSCYPLAFAVPAAFMFLGLVLIICGKPWYKLQKPEGNILADSFKCILCALWRKMSPRRGLDEPAHWLEYAKDKFHPQLLKDVREVLGVLPMYLPVPLFFALFDQQGSTWVFQASQMDGVVFNWFTIKPDQIEVLNPLFTVLLIPVFELVLYPLLEKIGIKRPLQYITIGASFCAAAFVMSAYLEYKLEPSYAKMPASGLGQLRIFNGLPCQVDLEPPIDGRNLLSPNGEIQWTDIEVTGFRSLDETLVLNTELACNNTTVPVNWTRELLVFEGQSTSYVITVTDEVADIVRLPGFDDVAKSLNNVPKLRVAHNLDGHLFLKNQYGNEFNFPLRKTDLVTSLCEIDPGKYEAKHENKIVFPELLIETGGVYTFVLQEIDSKLIGSLHTVTPPAAIHILWAVPQAVVIAMAEILFVISYISFAFTQAPERMKSIMTSIFQMTISFGGMIVVFVTKTRFFHRQTFQFLFYAGLMFLDIVLLLILSARYKYRETGNNAPSQSDVSPEINDRNVPRVIANDESGSMPKVQRTQNHEDELRGGGGFRDREAPVEGTSAEDTGNVASETGNVTSETGNVTSETGNVTSETGNVTSETGNGESGSVELETGNTTAEICSGEDYQDRKEPKDGSNIKFLLQGQITNELRGHF